MKVVHVLPRIITDSSGTAHYVTELCESLNSFGCDVHLSLLQPTILKDTGYPVHGFSVPKFPYAFRLGYSPAMRSWLREQAWHTDIIHNHSMWMMPNIYPADAVSNRPCKLIVSPHGTLSGWALQRSKWKKKIVWALGQKKLFRQADLLHATSDSEYGEIRAFGIKLPVAVIPNGIDNPPDAKTTKTESESRKLLFLSRIHEKKGLDFLLDAWGAIHGSFPDWELVIAGPLEGGYPRYVQKTAKQKELKGVRFTGELRGSAKDRAFFDADLFILPTRSENFGMAVAEALAHAVPVITTKGAPWRGLEKHRCGWWIDIGNEPLIETLKEAMSLSSERLSEMGARGREWMQRDFSWDRIGRMMYQTYEWLLGGGPPPGWVAND